MKKIDGYYVDENGNKWSENLFSEEKAIKFSETMVGCRECTDCEDCRDCSFCTNCTNCDYCDYCNNCVDCINCTSCINCVTCNACSDCDDCKECANCVLCGECRDCTHCRYCCDCIDCFGCADCSTCSNCNTCTDCSDCMNCADCRYCTGFKENPKHIMGESVGADYNDTPIVYWIEAGKEQCVVGFFRGTLDQLWDEVEMTHADNPQYIANCKKFIKAVRAYQEWND